MSIDVEQDCAIELLIYDVGLEDLVVESLRGTFCARHLGVRSVPLLNLLLARDLCVPRDPRYYPVA